MDYRKEIKELIKYLNEKSKESKEKAEDMTPGFARGLEIGYSSAYKLCSEWLHEILES